MPLPPPLGLGRPRPGQGRWIARAFGVSLRQTKAARLELVDLGWIDPEASDVWAERRWGRCYRIDLGWSPAPRPDGSTSAPILPGTGSTSSPPDLQTRTPSGRENHQEPGPARLAGARLEGDEGTLEEEEDRQILDRAEQLARRKESYEAIQPLAKPVYESRLAGRGLGHLKIGADSAPVSFAWDAASKTGVSKRTIQEDVRIANKIDDPVKRSLPAPSLDHVQFEDLKNTGRALKLFDQAVDPKLASPSEAGRLAFLAVVEHARTVGTSNPAGLFARLVRRGLWNYATQADEDAARRRLREHQHGRTAPNGGSASRPWPSTGPSLSEDARLVQAVRSATIRAGIFRDPWAAFRARDPGWSRGRWDAALSELGLR